MRVNVRCADTSFKLIFIHSLNIYKVHQYKSNNPCLFLIKTWVVVITQIRTQIRHELDSDSL
jgi:hypothetical protein